MLNNREQRRTCILESSVGCVTVYSASMRIVDNLEIFCTYCEVVTRPKIKRSQTKILSSPLRLKILFVFSGWHRMDKNFQDIRKVTVEMHFFHQNIVWYVFS
jgi:hypothetical protein